MCGSRPRRSLACQNAVRAQKFVPLRGVIRGIPAESTENWHGIEKNWRGSYCRRDDHQFHSSA
jgi:hypothetical protein